MIFRKRQRHKFSLQPLARMPSLSRERPTGLREWAERVSRGRWAAAGVGSLFALVLLAAPVGQVNVETIIQRSTEANRADWKAAPDYSYFEEDKYEDGSSKTYEVRMILGSPYRELVAVDGAPISPEDQEREKKKLSEAIQRRQQESPRERRQRVGRYQKDRQRNRLLMEQLTKAFDFRLLGEEKVDQYEVYELEAKPRPGYQPPNREAQVLTGMEGKLWIDKNTFQWVKVEATVIHPVSIAGFLARVEPGTRFELEKAPVEDGIWLPKHFAVNAHSKILFVFGHSTQADETYFGYHKGSEPAGSALQPKVGQARTIQP